MPSTLLSRMVKTQGGKCRFQAPKYAGWRWGAEKVLRCWEGAQVPGVPNLHLPPWKKSMFEDSNAHKLALLQKIITVFYRFFSVKMCGFNAVKTHWNEPCLPGPWSFLSPYIIRFQFIPIHYQKNLSTMKAPSCPDSHRLDFFAVIKISL